MVHVCRVCEETFENCSTGFSSVLVDIVSLKKEVDQMESDLLDSFNAFCFTCRRVTMSVPIDESAEVQVCYLRSQIECFRLLQAYGLVVGDNRLDN